MRISVGKALIFRLCCLNRALGPGWAVSMLMKGRAAARNISLTAALKVADALPKVLQLAKHECGSSLREYRNAVRNAQALHNPCIVYGRKNAPCRTSGNTRAFTPVAGRGTPFCTRCQQ